MAEKKAAVLKAFTFLILQDVTVDKFYSKGSTIVLSDRKTIAILKSNKFIK
jgi:hypothetical protein